jgi:hypothetical protein
VQKTPIQGMDWKRSRIWVQCEPCRSLNEGILTSSICHHDIDWSIGRIQRTACVSFCILDEWNLKRQNERRLCRKNIDPVSLLPWTRAVVSTTRRVLEKTNCKNHKAYFRFICACCPILPFRPRPN